MSDSTPEPPSSSPATPPEPSTTPDPAQPTPRSRPDFVGIAALISAFVGVASFAVGFLALPAAGVKSPAQAPIPQVTVTVTATATIPAKGPINSEASPESYPTMVVPPASESGDWVNTWNADFDFLTDTQISVDGEPDTSAQRGLAADIQITGVPGGMPYATTYSTSYLSDVTQSDGDLSPEQCMKAAKDGAVQKIPLAVGTKFCLYDDPPIGFVALVTVKTLKAKGIDDSGMTAHLARWVPKS